MDPPPIKLVMVQGPRKGETLGFPPATTIQIGRVVRGNTVAIKDAGVSTKHLIIEPRSGKWSLRDLGSSNGTFLNSKTVSADIPLDLRDGDIVKLGEESSIQIKIDGPEPDGDVESNQTKGAVEELKTRGRRTKQNQPVEAKDEAEGLGKASEKLGKVNSRTTRSKKMEIVSVAEKSQPAESIEPTGEGDGGDKASENLGRKMNTRSRKKQNPVNDVSVLEKVPENEPVDLIETTVVPEENLGRRVNTRTTRSRKNENSVSNVPSSVIEKVPGRRGRPRKQKSVEEELDGKETVVEEKKVIEDAKEEEEVIEDAKDKEEESHGCEVKENLEVIEDAKDNEEESHGCEVKENPEEELLDKEKSLQGHDPVEEEQQNVGNSDGGQQNVVKETVELELENMTLGQWFDYLECHLPKQITEETETMIEGMRRKAEKFGEYVIQQRNARELP